MPQHTPVAEALGLRPILARAEGQRSWRFTMDLVDQLLAILAGPTPGAVNRQLMAAEYTEDEVRGAWNYARAGRLHRVHRVGSRPPDTGGKSASG